MSAEESAEAILIVMRKLAKWIIVLVGVVVGVSAAIWAVLSVYDKWNNRPQIVTSLSGIGIGDKTSDIFFRLGEFQSSVPSNHDDHSDEVNFSKAEKNGRILFTARGNKAYTVTYVCDGKNGDFTSVSTIRCGSLGDTILDRFAGSVRVLCLAKSDKNAGTWRAYDVVKFGVRYLMGTNQVVGFMIADPADLEGFLGRTWKLCE